jgi:hypothetical protein
MGLGNKYGLRKYSKIQKEVPSLKKISKPHGSRYKTKRMTVGQNTWKNKLFKSR